MKYDVIFSILDPSEDDMRGGMFSAFPIHKEITRERKAAKADEARLTRVNKVLNLKLCRS